MIMDALKTTTKDNSIFDLSLKYRVILVDSYDKAAKDKLIDRVRDKVGFIIIDKFSGNYLDTLNSFINKFIVIDCDGLFLDMSVINYIANDEDNQYLLFRDNPSNFHHNSTRMSLMGNKYYLDYDFLYSPDIKERFEEKDLIDISNIPLEIIIGYKPPEMSDEDAKRYKEKIEYLEYLGIIGILDDNENPQVEADRWHASYLIEIGKPVPQDLIDRLLSYKK